LGQYAHRRARQTGELPRLPPLLDANTIGKQGIDRWRCNCKLAPGGIMSHLKVIVPAAILLGGFLVSTTASFGKPDYTKATKKQCVYCHAKVSVDKEEMNKNLTAPGKYYHEHKSLDGYQEKK
jgi:hypothetical protein